MASYPPDNNSCHLLNIYLTLTLCQVFKFIIFHPHKKTDFTDKETEVQKRRGYAAIKRWEPDCYHTHVPPKPILLNTMVFSLLPGYVVRKYSCKLGSVYAALQK